MASQVGPKHIVMDSWSFLEWLRGRDPGRKNFNQLLDEVEANSILMEMSRINYGEVVYSIRKSPDIKDPAGALMKFYSAPIHVHSVDDDLVDEAVNLKSTYSFAYADTFAAALAIRMNVPVATGDKEFLKLEADGLLALRWMGA